MACGLRRAAVLFAVAFYDLGFRCSRIETCSEGCGPCRRTVRGHNQSGHRVRFVRPYFFALAGFSLAAGLLSDFDSDLLSVFDSDFVSDFVSVLPLPLPSALGGVFA